MAKARTKKISKPIAAPKPDMEATPERIAQAGNDNMTIDDGQIEKAGEKAPRCRRFRDTHLERLKRGGRITLAQYDAGIWYLTHYEQAGIEQRQTANYSPATFGGSASTFHRLPNTPAQATAKDRLRRARAHVTANMLTLFEGVVLHDRLPAMANGQQRERFTQRIAKELQALAVWIGIAVDG
jgi:hypothetical protein